MQVFDAKPPGGRLFSGRRETVYGRLRRKTHHKKSINRGRGEARGSGRDGGGRLDGATRWPKLQVTGGRLSPGPGTLGCGAGKKTPRSVWHGRDPPAGRPVRNLRWGVAPVARGEGWHPLRCTKRRPPSRRAMQRSRPCVGSLLRSFPFRGSCAEEGVGGQRARQDARGKVLRNIPLLLGEVPFAGECARGTYSWRDRQARGPYP